MFWASYSVANMSIDLLSGVGPSGTAELTHAGPIPHTKISPNDEHLLIRALKTSIDNSQTYKQAMEGLHGVSYTVFLSKQVLLSFRSMAILHTFGRIIIWNMVAALIYNSQTLFPDWSKSHLHSEWPQSRAITNWFQF